MLTPLGLEVGGIPGTSVWKHQKVVKWPGLGYFGPFPLFQAYRLLNSGFFAMANFRFLSGLTILLSISVFGASTISSIGKRSSYICKQSRSPR